jgi:phosphonate transport system substrate-binding protein
MVRSRHIIAVFALLILLTGITYVMHYKILDIREPYPVQENAWIRVDHVIKDTVHVGVVSRFPSNVLYKGYQPLIDYLTKNTGYYFELVISRSYSETVQKLADGRVDAAFLGSYIYSISRDDYQLIPVLKPNSENGEPFFRSVVIVKDDSDLHSLDELRGRRLALPSEQSFSGNWLFQRRLGQHNITVDDIARINFFDHHHTVVYEIMRNNFDFGIVKDRVAQEFQGRGIRVIAESPLVPGSPLVVSRHHKKQVVSALVQTLLDIDPHNSDHRELISNWDPEFRHGFSVANARDYDEMAHRIERTRDQ